MGDRSSVASVAETELAMRGRLNAVYCKAIAGWRIAKVPLTFANV